MKKHLKVSMTATAALLALAGVAQAAPAELNIYGASAQYLYWNAQAQHYAQTKLGCTAAAPVNNGGKHGFVSATGCTSTLVPVNAATGKRDLDIRYSGIASAEGILAVKKAAPIDATLATGCNVANGERKMFASTSTTVCKQVHVGTSDVAAESLIQISSGQKLGPMGGGAFSADLAGVGLNSDGLTPNNTVVVPFGFFVNSAVTATPCTAGLVGNYATAASQCDTAPGKGDGALGAAATITNISREEASLIFSGVVADWSDLGAYFTAQPLVACLRHAGSGTHSALDFTVVNSNWGGTLPVEETPGSIWFNQGSTDEIKCVNGNATATPTGSLIGAIGYADADQAVGVAATSQNVKQLKYNGFYPTRTAIRNGLYDFYTNAWLYTNTANPATVNNLANDLVVYAQEPTNVPASKANYWAAVGEMKFNRAADSAYPAFTGASIPMLP
jgi:ABC-type phosphate transport system substrate-binding protein